MQTRVGVRQRIEQTGRRIVRDFMPDEHRELFETLPFLIAASAGADRHVWASLLFGEPGFVRSPTANSLRVDARPLPFDPLPEALRVGAPIGVLGIELSTRRRNRANGRVASVNERGFEIHVEQSFGNCPKYIQSREGRFITPPIESAPAREQALLSPAAQALLHRVDTTFLATSSLAPEKGGVEGLDASHRGGRPGFLRATAQDGASVITMPDFSGNLMFNTLGNLEENPNAGLLALDFDSGDVLSITGTARVVWDSRDAGAFDGAERFLEFSVVRGYLWPRIVPGWSAPGFSPHLRGTGTWRELEP